MIGSINRGKKTLPLLCVTCAMSFLVFPVDQKKAKMKMVNRVSPMKQELQKFIGMPFAT